MTTLLELLVDELEEWPEDCVAITQDMPRLINLVRLYLHSGDWSSYVHYEISSFNKLASDWQTAIITRSQWEAAKRERT